MEEKIKNETIWVAWMTGEEDPTPMPEASEPEGFRELEQTWDLAGTAYVRRNSNPDKAWNELSGKMNNGSRRIVFRLPGFLRYAALIAALFALGSVTYLLIQSRNTGKELLASAQPVVKSIQTLSKPAKYTSVTLPDGSSVKINANSVLKYPDHFTSKDRKVELSGEAYFDVVHDAAHPFVVVINDIRVEDIGTSFNISAYPGKDKVVVSVTSGSVRLVDNLRNETAILAAGVSGKFLKVNGKILVTDQLSPNFLAWITKKLTFHHTPLSTVFEELEDIYHVRIEVADPKIGNISYTANFEKFQLEDIVNVIARTHHLSVIKKADNFVFAAK